MPAMFLSYEYKRLELEQFKDLVAAPAFVYITAFRPGVGEDDDLAEVNFYVIHPGAGSLLRVNQEIRDYVLTNVPGVTQMVREITGEDFEESEFRLEHFMDQMQLKEDAVVLPDVITRDVWEGGYWAELSELISSVLFGRSGMVTIINLSA